MKQTVEFLLRHGYLVLFAVVSSEQVGLPIPAAPVLLAMGALAGLNRFSFWLALLLAVTASVLADTLWYLLGRTRGPSILNLLCRISLEPDSCVSNTKNLFQRHGNAALLFAKFVPGLSTVAPPMSGLTRTPAWKFVLLDSLGAAAWAAAFLSTGFLFRYQLERAAEIAASMGSWLGMILFGCMAAYIGFKYYQRRKFIRELRVARVTPEELRRMMESGEDVTIVDLRSTLELEPNGLKVPGAIWIDLQKFEEQEHEIPREKEVILYCS